MVKRSGFVSNSSSSSFIIPTYYLSQEQIDKILDHRNSGLDYADEWAWSVYLDEDEKTVEGSCSMDNFDMQEFLELIGVPMKKVKWDHY